MFNAMPFDVNQFNTDFFKSPYAAADARFRYNQAMTPSFGAGLVASGMNAMNNLGSNISNAFAQANAQSGYNRAAQVPYEVERLRQQGASQRLREMAPLIAALFSGGAGARGGAPNINTNYGAGVRYGS